MPQIPLYDRTGKSVGSVELADALFAAPVNAAVLHQVVTAQLAGRRTGTHDTKTRGEVSGAGRKLWRQKKTGRARIGSIRSPLWRHGGTVHGPTPRSYDYQFPKRKRSGALRAALSEKLREGRVIVLDSLELSSHRTADFAKALGTLGVGGGALILDEPVGRNLELAARNLPRCKVLRSGGVNVVDLLKYEYLVMTTTAARKLKEVLAS